MTQIPVYLYKEDDMRKKLTIELSEETHTEFKMAALKRKTTMREIVVDYIEKVIMEEQEKSKQEQK